MKLLEREPQLGQLRAALEESRAGRGRLCLVSGEAGIGKTSLLEAFAAGVGRACPAEQVLWGRCDALFTPRPLGPLFDIARQLHPQRQPLADQASDREQVFRLFLSDLDRGGGAHVVVFEDAHWADEGTLDLLKVLGRRSGQLHGLVVVTYRDDELGRGHPLWQLLGELPRAAVRRISLPTLSEAAVAQLADLAGRDPAALYGRTRGNPFFVTEVLANDGAGVPGSVREAVYARASRLAAPARELLDVVSVVPGRIERWLLARVGGAASACVEACVDRGVLEASGAFVGFRHDLARQAWEDGLDESRRRDLHQRILRALREAGDAAIGAARLVHHAAGSGDAAQVLGLAPLAASEAARLGAHRDAASHLARAVEHAELLPAAERAGLLERFAFECNLAARVDDAIRAQEGALALWRELGDRRREGSAHRFLSRLYWYRGEGELVRHHSIAATELLEPLGPCAELATAYGARAHFHMLRQETDEAITWGGRAIAMARDLGETNALIYALNTVGTAMAWAGDAGGYALLEESLRLASDRERHPDVTRAHCNLAFISAEWYRWEEAKRYLESGLRYCERWGIDTQRLCMISDRVRIQLYEGDWAAAGAAAAALLRRAGVEPVHRVPALAALARIRARRGDPAGPAALEEARESAQRSAELQLIQPVAIAMAETAWLAGRPGGPPAAVMEAYALALERATPWGTGELAYWLWRCGVLDAPPPRCAEPYALQMRGEWRAAADEWERIGCPFHRALALAESGEEPAIRDALAELERLGAPAVVHRLTREMRARGVHPVPRGARPSTRRNPAHLTRRQMEVLGLLDVGLTNEQIARRLFLSPRTVAHHVSAILLKLDARTRTEAATAARSLGIAPKMGS